MADYNSSSSEECPLREVRFEVGEEPPTKCFKQLSHVIEQKSKEGMKRKAVNPPGYGEVEHYFNSVESLAESLDPLLYWQNQTEYPLLSSVALDYLSIPASSAPIERVFSTAEESTTGKRN